MYFELLCINQPWFSRVFFRVLLLRETPSETHKWRGADCGKSARWVISPIGFYIKEFDMNWDIVEGNWKQFKGKVKAQWGKLTDDQLDVIAGKRVELAGKLQEAYGITKDEAEQQIKSFEKLNKD